MEMNTIKRSEEKRKGGKKVTSEEKHKERYH